MIYANRVQSEYALPPFTSSSSLG